MTDLIVQKDWTGKDIRPVLQFALRDPERVAIDDLEEQLGVKENRESLCVLKFPSGDIAGVFLVDLYQNFWFDVVPEIPLLDFLKLTIPLAYQDSKARFDTAGLDACEYASDVERISALEKMGFKQSGLHTLKYKLDTHDWNNQWPVPNGLIVRAVDGVKEVPALVELHRKSFESDQMTEEYRLAMMGVDGYDPKLDLVMEDSDGNLIAFCVDSIEAEGKNQVGYTDPVGVVPSWQQRGIGKGMLAAGVELLKQRGIREIRLGTSSENGPMQKLAEAVGFQLAEEKVWLELREFNGS